MRPFVVTWLTTCIVSASAIASQPSVDTVAGTGHPENNGDSGPAATINVGDPFGVEIGPDGALYITEIRNHRILRLDLVKGLISTVAGCGRRGYSGDGGPAVDAELNEPYEVRFDTSGNMYFVEMRNHIVRRVDAGTKTISTIAGSGRQGFAGDGGPATGADLNQPHSIALDGKGALYIADIGNHRIRRVDLKTGTIETIAGNSKPRMPRHHQSARGNPILGPRALFVEGETLWIALREGQSVWSMNLADGILSHVVGTGEVGYSGDGRPAAFATFNGPKGIAVAPNGNIYVVDSENNAIRRISRQSRVVSTFVGNPPKEEVEFDSAAAGSPLRSPHGICIAPDGDVYIGDTSNHRVLRIRFQKR